jgi:hypothetical protein
MSLRQSLWCGKLRWLRNIALFVPVLVAWQFSALVNISVGANQPILLGQPSPLLVANDCSAPIEQYIQLIDALLASKRIDARYVNQELSKNIPSCEVDSEQQILKLSQASKYFAKIGRNQESIFHFDFVTRENKQHFRITFFFNPRERLISSPFGKHIK